MVQKLYEVYPALKPSIEIVVSDAIVVHGFTSWDKNNSDDVGNANLVSKNA